MSWADRHLRPEPPLPVGREVAWRPELAAGAAWRRDAPDKLCARSNHAHAARERVTHHWPSW